MKDCAEYVLDVSDPYWMTRIHKLHENPSMIVLVNRNKESYCHGLTTDGLSGLLLLPVHIVVFVLSILPCISQQCLKLGKRESGEESIIDPHELQLRGPEPAGQRPGSPQGSGEDETDSESIAESIDDPEEGISSTYQGRTVGQRAKGKTGGKAKAKTETNHTVAPLQQVISPTGGQIKVKVPFSESDLNSWREEAKCFRENPEKVAKRFELIVKNQDIDWSEIDLILSELTETEKELIIKTARNHVEGQIATNVLRGNIDDIFPVQKPNWEPNNPGHYALLKQYRKFVLVGLRNAITEAVNWAALYDVRQG
ncbi:hypothetical protein BTVI_83662 [Pitangus sulphuratus]|nr:hypothetical protein BTVI_83662 [Pitangus sulphuratus]